MFGIVVDSSKPTSLMSEARQEPSSSSQENTQIIHGRPIEEELITESVRHMGSLV